MGPIAEGDGGTVDISAGSLIINGGSQVQGLVVSGFGGIPGGRGSAGDISIQAEDTIAVSGTTNGVPSAISTDIGRNAIGGGGDIELRARVLTLSDGAEVSSASFGAGNAGNLRAFTQDQTRLQNANILTTSTQTSGGAINIDAGSQLLLTGDSDISSSIFSGTQAGGDIVLTANSIIALEDSDILAFAGDGSGGDITLNTLVFFGERFVSNSLPPFDRNQRVDINATGNIASGNISSPDVSFVENDLAELSDALINPEMLVANSCVDRASNSDSTVAITGIDHLPQSLSTPSNASYSVGSVQTIPTDVAIGSSSSQRHIAEPQAVYQSTDGRFIMSQACDR